MGAIGALLVLGAPRAQAQMPTVDPGGSVPAPAAPPPAPTPQPIVVQVPPPGGEGAPAADKPIPTNWYAGDPEELETKPHWDVSQHGPLPEHHVVRSGDTLWDISWVYFSNPWEWPKLWSYNVSITNPHWIYPGDLVRLYGKGEAPVVITDPEDPIDVAAPRRATAKDLTLRHVAYVDREKLEFAAKIDGSVESKVMLSVGDEVYLSYPEGKPPKKGKRYAIYAERRPVKHPGGKKGVVGSYVQILGELTVVSVKKDKRARAVIDEAVDVIERGALVGPLQRQYRGDEVTPVPNTVDRRGTIVAMLRKDQIIGEGEIVFIDLGRNQQIKRGNLLHVVRRGDAYDRTMDPDHNVGQDDERFPARSVGTLIAVDVGKDATSCLVVSSEQEFGVGDFVLMRKAGE